MEQYIKKSALVAEIKRRRDYYKRNPLLVNAKYCIDEDNAILKLLDTLEVKEVDLEEEIKNGIDNLPNLYCYMEDLFNGNEEEGVYPIPEKVINELFEFAKYFFELGLKTKID